MIRFLRIFSYPNYWRATQYPAKRFCFNKPDDLASPKAASEGCSTPQDVTPTLHSEKTVDYRKYSRPENNAKILELIEALPDNPQDITMADVLNFYDSIKGSYLITQTVLKHPKFNSIREITEVYLLQFNTRELSNILVAILPSKAVMDDKLSRMIINALLKRANHLPFSHIIFIDFILHKYYSLSDLNTDCNILRLTMQRSFLSKIEDELNDLKGFDDLMKIVAFCNNNVEVITPKIANLITTSLLLFDDDNFTVSDIMSCMNVLSSFGELNDHVRKLLDKMMRLWCESNKTASEVRALLRILSANRSTIDKEQFRDSKLIRDCVNVVASQSDRKLMFSVQNEFNRLGFTSHELIDHLSKFFDEDIRHLTFIDYIVFCKACANADYKPSNWETKILPALKTFKFDIYMSSSSNFDWTGIVFDLDKLGYCDKRLIHKILNSNYLQSQKWYNQNDVKKLKEILNRHDASMSNFDEKSDDESSESDEDETTSMGTDYNESPIFKDLCKMFGSDKILSNVQVERNLSIPYILKMDSQSGEFQAITTATFSSKHMDSNELFIGIVLVDDDNRLSKKNKIRYARKQVRRIEQHNGFGVIILDERKWNELKAYERALIFYTKIVNMVDYYQRNKLKRLATDF